MVKYLALCVFALTLVSFGYGNVVPSRDNQLAVPSCGGYMFVDDEVVIDGPFNENCILQFETQEDRILAFSVLDGDMKDALQFLNIHNGFGIDFPILKVENQITHEVSQKNAPIVLYTTSSEAIVTFTKRAANSNMKLKIQKAVDCPLGIGDNTQCGRVVDDVSCYCAIFTLRTFYDQTMVCLDNKMKLAIFENRTEEESVQSAWPGTVGPAYWISLTDSRRESTWVWESTMTVLKAGDYTNWFPGRPSYVANNLDDCVLYGGSYLQFWGDYPCTGTCRAICEAQP
ncbi:C-type lectin mannose-binding isoform-like [Daphnia pulex]|uniref:C-type lectin mannose-binding isoform-like n=1 Tax=Daphnia pulex TaxID=6669 RepID=UPI001EDDFB6C|nr:C-type lectin mannose-binding isoform-like [Daphnia pulex]